MILLGWLFTGFLLIVMGLFAALYLYFRYQYTTWSKLDIPFLRPKFPFGNAEGTGSSRSVMEALKSMYDLSAGKPFVGTYMFCTPYLMVRDPELIKSILVKDFACFVDRGQYYNEKDDPLSGHIACLEGDKWKNMRSKLTTAFTSGKMKTMFPVLLEKGQGLVEALNEPARIGCVIEIKDFASRYTIDVISAYAFGINSNSLKNPNCVFERMGKKIYETWSVKIKFGLQFLFPELAEKLRLKTLLPEMEDFFLNTVNDTIRYRKEKKLKKEDFMELMIQLMDKGSVTPMEAAAQAFVFFAAGFDTSSSTLQFVLYELAVNPQVQETLRDEIRSVLDKNGNRITYEEIFKMDLLNRVIDESLRMHPPINALFRKSNRNYMLPDTDVIIPAGTRVVIPSCAMHYDPDIFPNPERFDPERFTEEEKSKRHHYTYFPFGEGPRNCLGWRFGRMTTSVGLVAMLSNYRFEVTESTMIPIVYDKTAAFTTPASKIKLKIMAL